MLEVLYYSMYMARTRDLLILVGAVVFVLIISALFLTGQYPAEDIAVQTAPPDVVLTSPRESYGVAPYEEESLRDGRETFIQKVRETYVPPKVDSEKPSPTSPPKEDPYVLESSIPPQPVIENSSNVIETTATTSYVNTGF